MNEMLMHLTLIHTKIKHTKSLDARLMICLMKHVKAANTNALKVNYIQAKCKIGDVSTLKEQTWQNQFYKCYI